MTLKADGKLRQVFGDIVLFDLDGTLADIRHRRHLVDGSQRKDWREFYARCVKDTVNAPVAMAFDAYRSQGYKVWIVSGRSDEVREQTERWLDFNGLRPERLLMRKAGDMQADVRLKQGWLDDGTIPKNRVLCVYDDRTAVVDMWREQGIACFQVAPGDF